MANFTDPLILTVGSKGLSATVSTAATADVAGSDTSDDYVLGTSDNDILTGGAIATTLAAIFTGVDGTYADGADILEGGAGDDQYIINDQSDSIVEGANGGNNDTVFTAVSYSLLNFPYVENIVAEGSRALTLTGNKLGNILDGSQTSTLSDTLVGGDGDDVYILGGTTSKNVDKIQELSKTGTDTIVNESKINISLARDTTLIKGTANIENVILTDGNANRVIGNILNNLLVGNGSKNNLSGGDGNDTLDGGVESSAIVDTLVGGKGNDVYIIRNDTDKITELSNAGTDTVRSSDNYDISSAANANLENITLLGSGAINATGNAQLNILLGNSGNNSLDGGSNTDTLIGNQGADTLNGGLGNDSMTGGDGNDTYIVDSSSDKVIETNDDPTVGGYDLVSSSVAYVLGANLEGLALTGSAAIKATGNALSNSITGNSGNNTIDGGLGDDLMVGGNGDDVYYVDSTGDIVIGGTGTDTVYSLATFNMAAAAIPEVVSVIFSDVTSGTTVTVGGATVSYTADTNAADVAGDFADTPPTGYTSSDQGNGVVLFIATTAGTMADMTATGATATVIQQGAAAGADAIEKLVLQDNKVNGAINGLGNSLDNTITGNSSDNAITGGTGADGLYGDATSTGKGNDTLNGGAGADTIYGYGGNDSIDGSTDADTIRGGDGDDTITDSSVADDPATAAINENTGGDIMGEKGNDTITAGAGADSIDGGDNNDSITAGDGNDTARGGTGDDTVDGGVGNDTLGGTYASKLTLDDAGNDSFNGGTGDDIIVAGSGNDIINGGAGQDNIMTNVGNDRVVFGALTDSAFTATSATLDLISDLTLSAGKADTIDLPTLSGGAVKTIGAAVTATITPATFVADMTAALGVSGVGFDTATPLDVSAAVVISGTTLYLAVDANKNDGFDTSDFVVNITGSSYTGMTVDSFV